MRRINMKNLKKIKIPVIYKRKLAWYENLGLIGIDGNITNY